MEMGKSYYLVTLKPEFLDLVKAQSSDDSEHLASDKTVIAITQGGFGQDVVDDERQVKERFLEHLFTSNGIDLPRSFEAFDQYFTLEQIEEYIDLDEER
jgi:hypothetical protein